MIFVANLKCNHTRASFEEYAKKLDNSLQDDIVVVFPPSTSFVYGRHEFIQGAQNFYPCVNGSFTGEIGKDMLDEFQIKTVMIGHSERRKFLHEDEELLKRKFEFAKKNNFEIIYCIGEDEEVYKSGNTKNFLMEQLKNIDLNYRKLVIAYEPIWAIGTGNVASAKNIEDILDFLSTKTTANLLYGGSVNIKNIKEISEIKSCDGVLVGTSSWDCDTFLKLIRSLD